MITAVLILIVLLMLVGGLYLIVREVGRKNWGRAGIFTLILIGCLAAIRVLMIAIASGKL